MLQLGWLCDDYCSQILIIIGRLKIKIWPILNLVNNLRKVFFYQIQDFLNPAKIADLDAQMSNLEAFLIKKKLDLKPMWLGETASGQLKPYLR